MIVRCHEPHRAQRMNALDVSTNNCKRRFEIPASKALAAVVAVYLTCPISLPTSTASGAEENSRVRAPRLATLFYCIGESLNRQENRLLKT